MPAGAPSGSTSWDDHHNRTHRRHIKASLFEFQRLKNGAKSSTVCCSRVRSCGMVLGSRGYRFTIYDLLPVAKLGMGLSIATCTRGTYIWKSHMSVLTLLYGGWFYMAGASAERKIYMGFLYLPMIFFAQVKNVQARCIGNRQSG